MISATRVHRPQRAAWVLRVGSWLADWLVVCGWLAVLTVAGLIVRSLLGDIDEQAMSTSSLYLADLVFTVLTVLPYLAYLALTESSPRHATLGKQWAGLVVIGAEGCPPGRGRVWLRNLVKALPWQLAHLGVSRAIFEIQVLAGVGATVLSLVLVAACALPALAGRSGLHDLTAGTRVTRRSGPTFAGDGPHRRRSTSAGGA